MLIPIIVFMYYAQYVLWFACGKVTCMAGLNAVVASPDSEIPVLGYTIP